LETRRKKWFILIAIARDYLAISAINVNVKRLFNMIRNICFYQRHYLKPDTIKIFIIIIYTNQYFLRENLRIIEIFKNAEKKVLPENIDDDEFKNFEIQKFINDNKRDMDFNENIDIDKNNNNGDDDINFAEFLLFQLQI
jgi:hypothetical protein